jgi:hypothetical protein
MFCAVLGLYTQSWCWYRCPEIGTSSIDWAQLSRFYLQMEIEPSLWNIVFWTINRMVFLDKERTMDNVQKHNICACICVWCGGNGALFLTTAVFLQKMFLHKSHIYSVQWTELRVWHWLSGVSSWMPVLKTDLLVISSFNMFLDICYSGLYIYYYVHLNKLFMMPLFLRSNIVEDGPGHSMCGVLKVMVFFYNFKM